MNPRSLVTSIAIAFSSLLLPTTAPAQAAAPEEPKSPSPLTLVQTIPLPQVTGGMNHFDADATRGRFFFTATSDKALLVIDLATGKVIHSITGYSPAAARFAPDLDLLCVSGAKAVTIYNGHDYAEQAKIDLASPVDEMAYDPQAHLLYAGITDSAAPALAVIDLPARRLVEKIKLPAKPQGIILNRDGSLLFANTPGAGQVTVIDCRKRAVAAEWKLSEARSNYPIALDDEHHRLFVGCRRPTRLLVLDTASGNTVASAETGGDADDMAFDPSAHRIYLACGDGVISTIQQEDPNHYRRLPDVPTVEGARNSLFVPSLKRFYVALPKHQDRPTELRAYEPSK